MAIQEQSAVLATAAPDLMALPNTILVGYPVDGRTPRAVRAAINAARPGVGDARFDGKTSWQYSTRWRTNQAGQCDPASAEVTYSITIILPELVDRQRLRSRDLAQWDRYFSALTHHEGNHARIAVAGAQNMQAAMRAATSCETMQQAARSVEATAAEANRVYDIQTRHGRTEGATFP